MPTSKVETPFLPMLALGFGRCHVIVPSKQVVFIPETHMSSVPSVFRLFIPVSDLDKGVEFYRRLLADDGRLAHRGRHYFDCGPVILAVIENNGAPIADHIYFSTSDL